MSVLKQVLKCIHHLCSNLLLLHLSTVIHLLLSEEIYDPVTKAPFSVEYINLLEVGPPCLVIRNFPPFVDEATLKSHFESLAGDQEIHSVSISHEAGEAQVMYAHAPGMHVKISILLDLFC